MLLCIGSKNEMNEMLCELEEKEWDSAVVEPDTGASESSAEIPVQQDKVQKRKAAKKTPAVSSACTLEHGD